jgi:endonuclease G
VLDNANDPGHDYGYGQVQYPLRFWKVIATVSEEDDQPRLLSYGFILDQRGPVERFGLEALDFGRFATFQVSLPEITGTAGVEFPQIMVDADTKQGVVAEREPYEINDLEKILLRKSA